MNLKNVRKYPSTKIFPPGLLPMTIVDILYLFLRSVFDMGNTPSCLRLKKFKKQKREKKCFYMIKTMNMELKEAERLKSGNPHHAEVAERLVRLGNQHNMFHAQLEDLDKASDALVITVRRDVDRSYYAARTIYETVLENSCNGQTNVSSTRMNFDIYPSRNCKHFTLKITSNFHRVESLKKSTRCRK